MLGSPSTGALTVHFIDVGQGDSILVRVDNRSMLIDGGPRNAGPVVSSYLKGQGVNTIDVVVSTHPHADHIGGLLTVLKDFPVKRVVDSGQAHPTQTYESYLRLIDRLDIPYSVGEFGQRIDLGPDVRVDVIGPTGNESGDLNERSIVIRLVHHNVSFLFTGDAGFPEERAIMATGTVLRSDVLKVPHHGSKYATSSSFLSEVRPEVSVIEVGENDYGHPSPRTLDRLHRIGTTVYRTDVNGNVVITSDGSNFTVEAEYPPGYPACTFTGTTPAIAAAGSILLSAVAQMAMECAS